MQLQIINPLEYPGWDELLLTNENCSFFLIPVMEIRSLLTGRRGVSLPFTDYCQPIISDRSHFKELIDYIIDYGKRAGWKYIEWRGGEGYFQDTIHSSFYYGHALDLTQNEQELISSFRSSTKRNINKAVKEGVAIDICNSLESIKEFYRLNCITRKHHGLPPQPYYFFNKIYEHIISKKKGFVVLASFQKRVISGAVYFHFGNKAIYKYGASDKSYQKLRANNLVMWEAIKWYAQNGFKHFSFGRTDLDHEGLLQFKRGWGTNEKTIKYHKYNFKKASFISERSKVTGFHNRVFNVIPIPVLKFVGSMVYKHIG